MTRQEWIKKCQYWKAKWPAMQPEYLNDVFGLNIYAVVDAISNYSPDDAVFMGDAGFIYYVGPQVIRVKEGQRMIFGTAQADMGWALPAAIGVAKAGAKNVICIIGDGSFMSNMQELAVIKEHELPIKIIVLNNNGYLSIKNTQSKFYGGRVHGVNDQTGVWFPKFEDVANAFGIAYQKSWSVSTLKKHLPACFALNVPMIFECVCTEEQQVLPAQSFKDGKQAPLHDMIPFLSDEEMAKEMLVQL